MRESRRTSAQDQWLRFFNRIVYTSLAPAYNGLDWLTLGAWWRLVRRALDYVPPGGRTLEIGFGPGKLHAELARSADFCTGIDLAWGMCRFTQRRLRRAGIASHVVRGDAFRLPYAEGTFDTVVSTFALSGLPDGASAVHEMARITGSGGRLVLVDIGLPNDGNSAGTFWARLWERMGDFLYDQAALLQAVDMRIVAYDEFGPGEHIRAVVGEK